MNNFYTLKFLVNELSCKISGTHITEIWSYKKDQIDLFLHSNDAGKLTYSASSPGTALFLDHRAGRPSRNAASFFPEIYGKVILGVELVSSNDRFVRITLQEDEHELLFMPFGSRPNLFLVSNDIVVSAFKDPPGWYGKPSPQTQTPAGIIRPAGRDISSVSSNKSMLDDYKILQKKIIAIDKQFPRGIIRDICDTMNLNQCTDAELKIKISNLKHLLLQPEKVFITAERTLSLLPASYLSHPPLYEFDSVNEAVRTLFLMQSRERRLTPQKNNLIKKLEKKIRGLEKQEEQFEKVPEQLHKADILEHYGNLLMSRPYPKSTAEKVRIIVPDWKNDEKEIAIPIEKGKTLLDQAQSYYKKAAGMRRDVASLGSKKKQTASRKAELEKRLAELMEIDHPSELDKWLNRHHLLLQETGLAPSQKNTGARPYRSVPLGNYEVWIGKSAKSNDEMLKLSHKEDIWMHVRGASGSHVILRNAGRTDWPESAVLRRAASFAAAWSKQSGSSLVPVMIAKRKHVRKPKGATPGLVTVKKERIEMVTPQKPDDTDS